MPTRLSDILKWTLIRPCLKKVTSDWTIPEPRAHWSDWNAFETPYLHKLRSKLTLIRHCQMQLTFDQIIIRSLSWRLSDHGLHQTQTIVQLFEREKLLLIRLLRARESLLIRLLCARIRFWSHSIALKNFCLMNNFAVN